MLTAMLMAMPFPINQVIRDKPEPIPIDIAAAMAEAVRLTPLKALIPLNGFLELFTASGGATVLKPPLTRLI